MERDATRSSREKRIQGQRIPSAEQWFNQRGDSHTGCSGAGTRVCARPGAQESWRLARLRTRESRAHSVRTQGTRPGGAGGAASAPLQAHRQHRAFYYRERDLASPSVAREERPPQCQLPRDPGRETLSSKAEGRYPPSAPPTHACSRRG